MIKIHTTIIRASEKKKLSYETTDGEIFDSKWRAKSHQRLIGAMKIRDSLAGHSGWFLVISQKELESLWLCASQGQWWDSEKKHHVSFPSWVQVSAYQDRDRYWCTEIRELTCNDLRCMNTLITNVLNENDLEALDEY